MSLDSDIALLKKVPVFCDLPAEQIRVIAFSAEPLNLADGAVLFREGERADAGYVVVKGTIVLVAEDGVAPVRAGPGSLIGETALILESQRPATATAAGPAEVIRVRRALIQRVVDEYPHIAVRMRDRMATRVRQAAAELARVGLRLEALGDE